jgi:hypothetical protein
MIGMIIYVRMPVSEAFIVSNTSERNRSTILGIYFFSHMEGGGVLTIMGHLIHLGFILLLDAAIAIFGVTSFAHSFTCTR